MPSVANLDLSDIRSVRFVLNDLYKSNPDAPFVPLLEARVLVESGNYEDAGKKLFQIIKYSTPNDRIFQISLLFIGRITNDEGFLTIFSQIKARLFDLFFYEDYFASIHNVLDALGFQKQNTINRLSLLSEHLVAGLANYAYDENKIDLAFHLEQLIYTVYINKCETEAAFKFGMALTKESARRAGQRATRHLSEQRFDFQNSKPVIGFFVHNASMLAHIANVHAYLKEVCAATSPKFQPIVFCLNGRNKEFSSKFREISVPVVYLDDGGINSSQSPTAISDRLTVLTLKCAEFQVDKMVWVCLATLMAFTFSMRIAKEQIWWSQKWQDFDCSGVDKRIWSFSMNEREEISGNEWLCSWFQKDTWLETVSKKTVRQIRNQFDAKVIVGCLARTEKIANTRYLNAICEILNANDDLLFLWTGRTKDPFVAEYFKSKGVHQKTEYIGWVDINIYARVLDVILDSFPFGNGNSILAAMQAGVPILLWKSSKESKTFDLVSGSFLNSSLDSNQDIDKVRMIFKGSECNPGGLYTCVDQDKTYVETANRLIRDADYRIEVGHAFQNFVNQMMRNPAFAEEKFTHHILAEHKEMTALT